VTGFWSPVTGYALHCCVIACLGTVLKKKKTQFGDTFEDFVYKNNNKNKNKNKKENGFKDQYTYTQRAKIKRCRNSYLAKVRGIMHRDEQTKDYQTSRLSN